MNTDISTSDLRRAIALREQIEALQSQLAKVLSGKAPRRGRQPRAKKAAKVAKAPVKKRKRRKLSAEARGRIVAAVKARWARVKAAKAAAGDSKA